MKLGFASIVSMLVATISVVADDRAALPTDAERIRTAIAIAERQVAVKRLNVRVVALEKRLAELGNADAQMQRKVADARFEELNRKIDAEHRPTRFPAPADPDLRRYYVLAFQTRMAARADVETTAAHVSLQEARSELAKTELEEAELMLELLQKRLGH